VIDHDVDDGGLRARRGAVDDVADFDEIDAIDTAPPHDLQDLAGARQGRWVRRAAIVVMAAFVALGLGNVFGSRPGSVSGGSGPLSAELTYPAATRGGLPTSWSVTIERGDGSPLGDVVVRTTSDLFDLFDHNDLVPVPDRTEQDGTWTSWHFDAVTSSQVVVRLDMRTQPDARWRHAAKTVVEVGSDRIELVYATWVLP
jgi:hypothetical protein